jgi:hypothetical protein
MIERDNASAQYRYIDEQVSPREKISARRSMIARSGNGVGAARARTRALSAGYTPGMGPARVPEVSTFFLGRICVCFAGC